MKRYRKFESWLKDVHHELAHPGKVDPYAQLMMTMEGLGALHGQLVAEPERTAKLLEVGRNLRAEGGTGRIVAEEFLWECVVRLARQNAAIVRGDDELVEDEDEGPEDLSDGRRSQNVLEMRAREALQVLCAAAILSYRFRRARDSFASRRRKACFDVWAQAITVLDLPESFELARQAVVGAKDVEAASAVVFLDACYRSRDVAPDKETERHLKALMKRASSSSTVVAVLDLLFEAGLMTEESANDALKRWETKHYGRPTEADGY